MAHGLQIRLTGASGTRRVDGRNKSSIIMMKKILLGIILLVLSDCFSQITSNNTQALKNSSRENVIGFYPLNLFNFLNPSVRFGYQRNLNSSFNVQFSTGIILPHSLFGYSGARLSSTSVNYKYSGYYLSVELKYIMFQSKTGKHNLFIGIEPFFSYQDNYVNSTFVDEMNESYEDFFNETKDIFGLNSKIGKQFMFGKFLMEIYGGIGIAHYSVNHLDRDNFQDDFYSSFYEYLHKEGKYFRLTFPFNMKIGYRF